MRLWFVIPAILLSLTTQPGQAAPPIDFNRDIRPLLSNNCFFCHGPDPAERKGGVDGLRLDTFEGATTDLGSGHVAISPGKPDTSALLERITTDDPDLQMPPKGKGKRLTPAEVELVREWIRQGAKYAKHWSYELPIRPPVPAVKNTAWPRNDVDRFLLACLEKEGLSPAPEADRASLIRRASLDLIGLPPTPEEVDAFVQDTRPDAYEQMIDALLSKDTYGEHWARLWLDLARYADSAGYADDPSRTIWAYRDWVIQAYNGNMPFDQFTVEQIAGDLLPSPTRSQLVATAFHRNTLTNNEGGTNDEEFRNVAIVDRVNTTMAVWMGTTIACAQCHTHKYDPLSQEEFFRLFAIFNNTDDADRRDESPLVELWSDEQLRRKEDWTKQIATLEQKLKTATPELSAAQAEWERSLPREVAWRNRTPSRFESKAGLTAAIREDGTVRVEKEAATDTYTVELPIVTAETVTALRLETQPGAGLPGQGAGFGGGNFVVTRVGMSVVPPTGTQVAGRFVRIEIPGPQKILSLAEVQVLRGTDNLASRGEASQSTTDYNGPAKLAIDGNPDGDYAQGSVTHTAISDDPWWELDLKGTEAIDSIVLWNRTGGVENRLSNFRLTLLDDQRKPVWQEEVAEAPMPSRTSSLSGARGIRFTTALADYAQKDFPAAGVLDAPAEKGNKNAKRPEQNGWAVGGAIDQPHQLTLIPESPVELPAGGRLVVMIEQSSPHPNHLLGQFRLATTTEPKISEFARVPSKILEIVGLPADQRTAEQSTAIQEFFLSTTPLLQPTHDQLALVRKQLADAKPETTVPVMKELAKETRRVTRLQHRGNFLDLGQEVHEGIPAVFATGTPSTPMSRLDLAKWLISDTNPMTARILVNRYWEQLFGIGIVRTSEEFGSQGELPYHPELLDWLATEIVRERWDAKALLRLLVTSSAYRQSSRVSPELYERDPDNRLVARGPRFRLPAETIRDQALFVSGLLSPKMYGPPTKPPQPSTGLNAAFGAGIDWQTSTGDDKFRRGLYTTWRRSNPYPSMTTFDAPNREVCTISRSRTNTPLQALVTLNDPVFIEASQALARRMAAHGATPAEHLELGFRLCASRSPSATESARLIALYEQLKTEFDAAPEKAKAVATKPLGDLPAGLAPPEAAAWTVVANVLLNLDEVLMKR
ncbi:DUF1553 domain-containing protein [Planctomyces sp. SH-PL14]|uniref:DUF1553 domain-containing protein n=1 Tax=Planctomyces sp. SH-PL14 TaxID=1632864 RepID=UPI00078DC34D|nr:DUF1553 domain-containing protein [Planctomyces sp. SH-PL14]AMV21311.1 Planctomycete cytochrome C [Planctomyces sp. SH-PL14]